MELRINDASASRPLTEENARRHGVRVYLDGVAVLTAAWKEIDPTARPRRDGQPVYRQAHESEAGVFTIIGHGAVDDALADLLGDIPSYATAESLDALPAVVRGLLAQVGR